MKNFRTISLWIIRIGLFAIPFIPLFVSNALFFPYITGKAFIFRTIVEVVFALWLVLVLWYKEYKLEKTPLLIALGTFVGVLTLATIFGANPGRSMWSNFERSEGLITHLHLFAYFLVLAHVFSREQWRTFFNLTMGAGLIQFSYLLSQRLGYLASPQGGFRTDGTIGNPTYVAAYMLFVGFFALIVAFDKEPIRHLRWIWGSVLAAFVMLLYGAAQMYGVSQNSGISLGTFFKANPMFLIGLVGFIALFVLTFLLKNNAKFWQWLSYVSACIALIGIYFTATRGVILALGIGAILVGGWYLWWAWQRGGIHHTIRWFIAAGLAFIILLGIGVKAFPQSSLVANSEILSRIASISLAEGKTRFIIWGMGLEGVKERPILGWGPENYNLVFAKYYDPRLYTQEPWFDRSHNFVLDWLISAGILGLVSYLGIFATGMYTLWKAYLARQREQGVLAISLPLAVLIPLLLIVYLMQNLFVFDQLATYLGFFAILAYIHFLSREERVASKTHHPMISPEPLYVASLGLAVIAVVCTGYFAIYKPLVSNLALLKAYASRDISQIPYTLSQYERALAYGASGANEALEQLAQFSIAVIASQNVPLETKEKAFTVAVKAIEKGEKNNPNDPRMKLFMGALYNQAGQRDEALKVFEEALALSPRKQQIMFEIADVYIRNKDYVSAEKILKKAFDLAPKFSEARVNLVAVYIISGQQERADALIKEVSPTKMVIPKEIIAQAYASVGNYQRLLGVWQAFVEDNPKEMSYRKNVAAVYLQLGKPQEAIKTLQEAIKIDPGFEAEAKEYIKAIQEGKL